MNFIIKMGVLLMIVLFSTSCKKQMSLDAPDVTATIDQKTILAGDSILIKFSGDANFITFYPDMENSQTGIPIKNYQELPLAQYFYVYDKPGTYTAKLVFKNAIKNDDMITEKVFNIEVRKSDWLIQEEINNALAGKESYSKFLEYLGEVNLPSKVKTVTMFLVPNDLLGNVETLDIKDYIIGQSMTLQEIIAQQNVKTVANNVLDVVKIGQDVYINGSRVVEVFTKGNIQFVVFENIFTSAISRHKLLSVKRVGEELYISSKYTQQKDLLILFKKSLNNLLMTFNRVGYISNSSLFPIKDPQIIPTDIITTSGNISAISLTTAWAGGNYLKALTNPTRSVKTAKTSSFNFTADGQEMTENSSIYAKKVVVTVQNIIYDARTTTTNSGEDILNTELCTEDIVYTIEGNNIKIEVSHKFKNKTPVNIARYYGMQTGAQGQQMLFPNGHAWDFVSKANFSATKDQYPLFNRFIQKNVTSGWYEAAYLLPDVGLGDRSSLIGNQPIYLVDGNTIYHSLMAGVTGVSNGAVFNWSGIYSWFMPIIDNDQLLAYEMRNSDKNRIVIDIKKAFEGVLELPMEYHGKQFKIVQKETNISSIEQVKYKGIRINSQGVGSVILEF